MVKCTQVIAAAMDDAPGGLAHLLELLSEANVGIEYMYAFIAKSENEAYVVMRIEAEGAAVKLLRENGFEGME